MTIGARIKIARKTKNFTQAELAERVGVHEVTLRNWENGEKGPNSIILSKLADTLNTSVDYLLEKTNDPSPPVYGAEIVPADGVNIQDFGDTDKLKRFDNQFDNQPLHAKPMLGQTVAQNNHDDFEDDDPLRVASKKLLDGMTPEQLRKSYEYLSDQKRLRELEELKGA
jgi:transcriptional regulator with XRE-family HTH domain